MKSMRSIFCLLLVAALCLSAAIGCAATLTLPANLRAIEAEAFCGDTSLDEVVLPEGLERIESRAFAGSSVTFIDLPESLTEIADDAFDYCDDVYISAAEGSYAYDWAAEKGFIETPAENETPASSFWYTVDYGRAMIDAYVGEETEVVIPPRLGGRPVTHIGEYAFSESHDMTSVTIPDSVIGIGEAAFCDCTSLVDVKIAGSVENIGDVVFAGCESLEKIKIPDSVVSIGEAAFQDCISLTDIMLSNSIEIIETWTFYGCNSLSTVIIPDSVKTIAEDAFEGCSSLGMIIIPDSVTSIESYAFYCCENLRSIYIPKTVTSIGESAFEYCDYLTIYGVAGSYAEKYANINEIRFVDGEISYSAEDIYEYEIYEEGVWIGSYYGYDRNVVIPETIEDYPVIGIDEFAFSETNVMSVHIPSSVTDISSNAFFECFSLTDITVSDENLLFESDDGVLFTKDKDEILCYPAGRTENEYAVPDGVVIVCYGAFQANHYIESVTLPDGVILIDEGAFFYCSNLKKIYIPLSVTKINEDFRLSKKLTIYGITGSYAETYAKENGIPFISRDFEYEIIDDDEVTITRYVGNSSDVIIPSKIEEYRVSAIGESAFWNCDKLTSIMIPHSVTDIGDYAFAFCDNLKSIELDSVINIGREAFKYCSNLSSVTLSDSIKKIEEFTFYNCNSLRNITIPDSVKSIGYKAFENCYSLMSVTLPDSLINIEGYAFYGCSSLTRVKIPFKVYKIDELAFAGCSNLIGVEFLGNASIEQRAFVGCPRLTIYGNAGTNLETVAKQCGIPFVAGRMPSAFADIADFSLNSALTEITIPVGSTLAFGGMVHAGDDAQLVAVQASVFDASDHTKGVKVARAENINAETFDLSSFADIVVGKTYSDDNQTLTMEAGKSYDVMLYATNTYGCGFESIPTIRVNVVREENVPLKWTADMDGESVIVVNAIEGTPDTNISYLFIAEDSQGRHYSGTIPAGVTSQSFEMAKDLMMPRAEKYALYVLPKNVELTDENRTQYFIKDIVRPLWEGNMIQAVRSGIIDVTDKNELYIGDTIEIDWDGSYGVETTEVVVSINGATLIIDPIEDKDGPETIKIDTSELVVSDGDVLEIIVTVSAPNNEAGVMLEEAGHKSMVDDEWEGVFRQHPAIPTYVSITVTNADGSTSVYDKDNPMHLYVGDHNYQKGWELNVTAEDPSLATYKIYSDNPESVFPYRNEAGEVFIQAKKDRDANIYISHIQADSLSEVPEEHRYLVCKVDMPTYRALLIGQTYVGNTSGISQLSCCANDISGMERLLDSMSSTYYLTSTRSNLTKSGMQSAISATFGLADDNDVSLLYYSGHGAYSDDSKLLGALVGFDSTLLTVAELKTELDKIPGQKVVILDSCHSGAHIGKNISSDITITNSIEQYNNSIIQEFALKTKANDLANNGYYVITAAHSTEESFASNPYSVFTAQVLKGSGLDVDGWIMLADLNDDEMINIYECFKYAYDEALKQQAQHAQQYPENSSFVFWAK